MQGVGKMKYNKSYLARRLALSLIIGGMFVSSAYALPQGGAVVGGGSNGNIGGSGNVMEITGTGSNNVAIKWEQFNIANGETVNFKNMANVLNYVTGNTKSEIYGALNGQNVNVFLLNPNGILFGKGAAVNVGSLYASTGKMTDAAINGFNGTPAIDLSSVTADVLNLGAIRADKVTIEGANISLGNAADIKKQNGDAIAAADQANYILKAEGTINVGYETIGTKNISIIENGVSTEHAIRDYSAGAAEKGSTLFTGKKLNGSEANNVNDCMLISDIYELQSIQDNRAGRYMLTKDIDGVATKNWNSGAGFKTLFNDSALKFMGVFDGAGYTISDLYINSSTGKYGGLFGVSGPVILCKAECPVQVAADQDSGGGFPQRLGRAAVGVCHLSQLFRVGHYHERPVLCIDAARPAHGGFQQLVQLFIFDGLIRKFPAAAPGENGIQSVHQSVPPV